MLITELASKPQLVEITLEDQSIIDKYGEPISFWVWDRQPMDKYIQMAQNEKDIGVIMNIAKEMILDDTGKPVISGEAVLPGDVAFKALTKVVETLGK